MKTLEQKAAEQIEVFIRVGQDIADGNDHRITELPWGCAQLLATLGFKISRSGWNGKGMFVAYSHGTIDLGSDSFWIEANRQAAEANGGKMTVAPYFTLKTAQDTIQMGWIPSMGDLNATDWIAEKVHVEMPMGDVELLDKAIKRDDVNAFIAATHNVKPLGIEFGSIGRDVTCERAIGSECGDGVERDYSSVRDVKDS